MSCFKVCLTLTVTFFSLAFVIKGEPSLEYESTTCQLLSEKFDASNPWTSYPIIFEPITRGRLTVWTGLSTLPTSEFRCYAFPNGTNEIVMDFSNFANKLEWTFYDQNRGLTHHGVTVNHNENSKYKLSIKNKQAETYLECNTVDGIEHLSDLIDSKSFILTSCPECENSLLSLVENQLKELIKQKLNERIMDNLQWHVTQLVSNQHFSSPLLVNNNFN